ncbi:hypothetical protein Plav_3300 [Parvibaculum lavamentivorans DS-1]|uniref:ATP-grasp domain-containing protein n=1 Tax=Parvibaculum lavamentivorans (strain DS-1 / DSM 13023 / NCIMB 13966) TaxID=402881 RepID=A7HYC2_PARL1|nr:hypothetical protein [Parvibaculum lavamentivorans]ABS64905.1 hypothetical protein Plav_3300 [Parvibaculum lavamentivorans DS-1]
MPFSKFLHSGRNESTARAGAAYTSRAMPAKTRNLILINRPYAQEPRDFVEIAERMAVLAPEIDVRVVDAGAGEASLPAELWQRPTLSVCMTLPGRFRPPRGRLYHGFPVPKFEQMRKFAEAGLPVPRTAVYALGRRLDPAVWGSHVIVKPTAVRAMSNGDAVFLMRTERVAERAPVAFPPGHAAHEAPLLVQQFIDTGDHPWSYRVLTLFGAPIMSMIYRAKGPRPQLGVPDEELLRASFASNVDPHFTCTLDADPEVLAFARRAAEAMPRIPLQGLDIIREERTGRLYILEANPGGNTWHFSSKLAEEGRKEVSREERMAQFDAWGVAAQVLAERTLREAG